jgi:hypothetical protein
MTSLQFIADERLRAAVERDKREMASCLENENCKATLLLAGSIVEAILVDYFLAFPGPEMTSDNVLKAELWKLIDRAEEEQLIGPQTKQLSTIIRNYRNLIHPGREYRLNEKVDINRATVAASLVEIILEEVAENFAKRVGYTAEQAIDKIWVDPTSITMFSHILRMMAPLEKTKLFRAIPEVCKGSRGESDSVVDSFVQLHRMLKKEVAPEVVKIQAEKAYEQVRSSSRDDAMHYLRFFGSSLDELDGEPRGAMLSYAVDALEHWSQVKGLMNLSNRETRVETVDASGHV